MLEQFIWDSYIQPPFYVRHFPDPENLLDITLVKLTVFDINEDLSVVAIHFFYYFLLLGTFNSLLRVAAESSDGDKPVTQLALGLVREMLAIGIGNFDHNMRVAV